MARTNYSYEKRQKEILKQKKKDEKRQKKLKQSSENSEPQQPQVPEDQPSSSDNDIS
jgi:hypothetical protein